MAQQGTHTRPRRFPDWIKRAWASGQDFSFTKDLVEGLDLHTVCQSARCPNMAECWSRRTATLMVLGNTCTRACRFCSVPSGKAGEDLSAQEPAHVAEAVAKMNLRHAVITSVTRDDLPDGGAAHIADTVYAIRERCPNTTIELLTPDFLGNAAAIDTVLASQPDVFGHNIETVQRLYEPIRGKRLPYHGALGVLQRAADYRPAVIVKSAFMVGHGETPDEVRATLADLREHGVEAVAMGQYLRPSPKQREVEAFIHPDEFQQYEQWAYDLGFAFAVAGPFVRSSYRSEELMETAFAKDRARAAAQAG